jgi:hypothetical protein
MKSVAHPIVAMVSLALLASSLLVSVDPDNSIAAPPRAENERAATALLERRPDVDRPTLGQAETPPAAQRSAETLVPDPVKGSTAIALDVTAEAVLNGVDSVVQERTRRVAGPTVKVGVIGFFDATLLSQQIRKGDLPTIPAAQRACFLRTGTCRFGTPGARTSNLVSATIYGRRPSIELYLVEAASLPAMRRAVNWLADKGVQVVVPMALVPWDDSGDGTGPAGRLLADATDKGMYVVAAAGDSGVDGQYNYFNGSYYRWRWSDTDGDDWGEFRAGDESLGAYCGSLYGLRWSDWNGRATDYDLYVSDATITDNGIIDGTDRRLIGGRNQSKKGVEPIEANDFRWLCNHDPKRGPVYDKDGDNLVSLWVRRTGRSTETSRGDVLELMVLNGSVEYATGIGNVQDPWAVAADPGVITAGATLANDHYAWFSPLGPTNDRRLKPEVVASGCYRFTTRARCDPENSEGKDTFRSTAIAAGAAASTIAGFVRDFDISDARDLRWLIRTYVDHDMPDAPGPAITKWPNARYGYGQLLSVAAPSDARPPVSPPWTGSLTVRSPSGTAAQLDRTFSTVTPEVMREPEFDDALSPRFVTITVTGARRAGTVEIWGRGQTPSAAVAARFEKSTGTQTRTIAVRDAIGLWVRATTGGNVSVRLGIPFPGTGSSYAAIDEPILVRQKSDGPLPAGEEMSSLQIPDVYLLGTTPIFALTVHSPSQAGVLKYQNTVWFRFQAGPTVTFYGSGPLWTRLKSSVPITVDLEVFALQDGGQGAWRRVRSDRRATLEAGVDRTLDLGPLTTGTSGTADVLVQVATTAASRGTVSMVDTSGHVRHLFSHRSGTDSIGTIVRTQDGKVTLRSTSAMKVRFTVLAQSTAVAALSDMEPPPSKLIGTPHISADGSVIVVNDTQGSARTVRVWNRAAGTLRMLDTDPGPSTTSNATVAGVSADGSVVAYTIAGTPASLVIHHLDTDARDVYPLPSIYADAPFLMATGDLSVFVRPGTARTFRINGAVLDEVNLTGWEIEAINADGNRLIARAEDYTYSLLDLSGNVISTLPTNAIPVLSGDGQSYVTRNTEVVTGATIRRLCPNDVQLYQYRPTLDRTGARAIVTMNCPRYGAAGTYLVVGSQHRRLGLGMSTSGVISQDGSTAVLSVNDEVKAVLSLD